MKTATSLLSRWMWDVEHNKVQLSLITAGASVQGHWIGGVRPSVRPSVCSHYILWTSSDCWLLLTLIFCMCRSIGHDNSSPGLEINIIGQGQRLMQTCLLHIHTYIHTYLYSAKNRENESEAPTRVRLSTAVSCAYWLMVAIVGFYCDVISCELEGRGVRRAKLSLCGSG